jgi:hypothetical protein
MQGIVYDCEVLRCIPPKGVSVEGLDDGFSYCSGWEDFKNIGVSVVCAADLQAYKTWVFCHPNIHEFIGLITDVEYSGGYICGFYSRNFDDRLMIANKIPIITTVIVQIAAQITDTENKRCIGSRAPH